MRKGLGVLLLAASALAAADEDLAPFGPGAVRGRVMGKDGTLLGVNVRVLVDGQEVALCRTDFHGRFRVEAPAGEFELEAKPEPWTELDPIRRRMTVAPGTEVLEDFVLGGVAGASGCIRGIPGDEPVTLFAIRVEDYPACPSVEALGRAPKVVAEARGMFTFTGLAVGATYRVTVDGCEWEIERPVFLRAGDTGIVVPLVPPSLVVEAFDIEARGPLACFRVKVIDRSGQTCDEIETRDGRVAYRPRRPKRPEDEPAVAPGVGVALAPRGERGGEPPTPWKIVVEAEGYLAATGLPSGTQRIVLQRARKPNVLLLVRGDEGRPIAGELRGWFEAAEQPDGAADAHVARDDLGCFRAILPPGAWRLTLAQGDAAVHVRVDVPRHGTVTVEPPPLPSGKP